MNNMSIFTFARPVSEYDGGQPFITEVSQPIGGLPSGACLVCGLIAEAYGGEMITAPNMCGVLFNRELTAEEENRITELMTTAAGVGGEGTG